MPVIADLKRAFVGTTQVQKIYLGSTQVYSNELDPRTVTGLQVWLDATKETSISGQWTDRSGFMKHGSVVGSPAPTVMVDGSANGQKFVRFKANEGRVRNSSSGITFDYTLVYLVRRWGNAVGRAFSCIYPPPNFLCGWHSSGYACCYDNGWLRSADPPPNYPSPWQMFGMDGKSAGGYQARFFINGVLSGTVSSGGGMNNTYGLSGYDAAGAQETMDCDVGELLLWNRKLTDAERGQVEAYLRTKWGL